MTDPEKKIEQKTKALFDESVEELDAATLSRLNQGRQKALEELQRPDVVRWGRWVPVAGVAGAAVVAVVMMNGPTVDAPGQSAVTATDFEMLIEADSLEMLEDLEFFSLLDQVDAEANGNVG